MVGMMSDVDHQHGQANRLKQKLLDFILEAEGDLATALETYSADQSRLWTKTGLQGVDRLALATDMFLTEGRVTHASVLDIFVQHQSNLSETEHALVVSWHHGFNGLFLISQVTPEGYRCMNWLTEKHYFIVPNDLQTKETLVRLQPGEIVVTRILPISDQQWMFSGPMMLMGKLGKPKLAVAIGNFKDWFPHQLYGDAPELLEEAWASVERYHREFTEFFGGDRLTLSGHELGKKLAAYQEHTTQRRLEDVGMDSSKSLKELAEEAGISEEEISESAKDMGEEGQAVRQLFKQKKSVKMMMPPIELPKELCQAKAVTVIVHPRWGQTFLTDFSKFVSLLEKGSDSEQHSVSSDDVNSGDVNFDTIDQLTLKYLKDGSVNAFIWHTLAEEYPTALTASLRRVLDNPEFTLEEDLDNTLMTFDKPLEPHLPEIASVPLHLHTLFQEALQAVSKKKSKRKGRRSPGFGS